MRGVNSTFNSDASLGCATPMPPTTLRHLRAARELDFQQIDRNAEVDLMIAGIAREHDQPELALAHYQRFLANKIRDARVTTVQEIVAALTAELASDPRS